jgi:hypothetical protein
MQSEFDRIEKAKVVLQKIAKGVDPLTGELIDENSFLNDTRIIRCFYFVSEILDSVLNGTYSIHGNKLPNFIITPEQKSRVQFSPGKIGVNEFSKNINECIDLSKSKKLTGVELNKRLKNMGLLSEIPTENSKSRTTLNDNSPKYGFETERKSYNGVEYEKVVINDIGKKYLLDNIETIMEVVV